MKWKSIACAVTLAAAPVACTGWQETRRMSGSQAGTLGSGQTEPRPGQEKATFAAGCFWGVEAAFRRVRGVVATTVGYTGGHYPDPSYEDVCSHKTGHAEAVRVMFDPGRVSYEELLQVFWSCHDPTLRNRQGPDVGSQYRSAVFCHGPEQEAAARASRDELDQSGRYSRAIATEIVPASTFYPAEEYHQRYLEKQGRDSCPRGTSE